LTATESRVMYIGALAGRSCTSYLQSCRTRSSDSRWLQRGQWLVLYAGDASRELTGRLFLRLAKPAFSACLFSYYAQCRPTRRW